MVSKEEFSKLRKDDYVAELIRVQKKYKTPEFSCFLSTGGFKYSVEKMICFLWEKDIPKKEIELLYFMYKIGDRHLYSLSLGDREKGYRRESAIRDGMKDLNKKWDELFD